MLLSSLQPDKCKFSRVGLKTIQAAGRVLKMLWEVKERWWLLVLHSDVLSCGELKEMSETQWGHWRV